MYWRHKPNGTRFKNSSNEFKQLSNLFQESQEKRGGGTVCTNNQKFAALYQNCVTDIQKC